MSPPIRPDASAARPRLWESRPGGEAGEAGGPAASSECGEENRIRQIEECGRLQADAHHEHRLDRILVPEILRCFDKGCRAPVAGVEGGDAGWIVAAAGMEGANGFKSRALVGRVEIA